MICNARRLSTDAEAFLQENGIKTNDCIDPYCGQSCCLQKEIIALKGPFSKFPLYRYDLQDGGTAYEYIQFEIPGSGSVTFLGLICGDNKFEWPTRSNQ